MASVVISCVNFKQHASVTIICGIYSCWGMGPGSMLILDEYNFGIHVHLSRLHDRHSPDYEFTFSPGNRLEQVGISNVVKCP